VFKCHCCSGECKKSGHYRNRNRVVQRFLCVRCGRSFSESQPLDGLRLDHSKVVQIVRCLTEGVGIRATARLVDCDPHTVLDVLGTVGEKCERLHDKWVRDIKTGSLQIDELWSRVGVREGEVQAARRYSPAPYVGVTIETIAGTPRADRICTSHVERCNLTVRHFNKRFVRLGLGWSRKLENHRASVALFVAAYNFCKVHSTMGCTPAVALKITEHTWTVEELIDEAAMDQLLP
jgi:transposase-like protein